MHFYEASIITTKDGMYCQVYGNEHPLNSIIVKPKYIPTDKIECDALPYRFISGKRVNRLNMWIDGEKLKSYLEKFKETYPDYILKSDTHEGDRLFFSVPIDKIERIYFPRRGFSELMRIERKHLDKHLKMVKDFGEFLLKSGLSAKDFGVTYSTLMGHYMANISDVNIVVYGKENYWKLMNYLKTAKHPLLRWKTDKEWLKFREKRSRKKNFSKEEFLKVVSRKKTEGFFGNSFFILFCAEKEEEVWFKWGEEKYKQVGEAKIRAEVVDNFSSVVRPGMYEVKNTKTLEGLDIDIKKVVFYSRDYCMLVNPGEQMEASGVLEEVTPKNGEKYYRLVVGYFDSYVKGNRENEYIKGIFSENSMPRNRLSGKDCEFCKECKLSVGDTTDYGAKIVYRIGSGKEGWFATLSPKVGGDPERDFSIQLIPNKHLRYFSEMNDSEELAKNYGIAFAKISSAVSQIIKEELKAGEKIDVLPVSTYGKCKHPDEHIHIKLFPWRGDIGQPFTVDSSYGRKEVFRGEDGEEFVKMTPVRKKKINKYRLDYLSNRLIKLLK